MKGFINWICWLLVIGHLLTEAYIIVWKVDGRTSDMMIQPFWASERKISLLWYIKDLSDLLLWSITYFVMARIAYRFSHVLFMVVSIFFFYHIVDAFMYLYNYKNTRWFYIVMLVIDVCAAPVIAFKLFKNKSKYKSIV